MASRRADQDDYFQRFSPRDWERLARSIVEWEESEVWEACQQRLLAAEKLALQPIDMPSKRTAALRDTTLKYLLGLREGLQRGRMVVRELRVQAEREVMKNARRNGKEDG